MRPQTSYEPFDRGLDRGASSQRVQHTCDAVVGVPKGSYTQLCEQNGDDGNTRCEESCKPYGYDNSAPREGELRVDELAVRVGDGNRTCGSGRQMEDDHAYGAGNEQSDDVNPCLLDPLAKARLFAVDIRVVVEVTQGPCRLMKLGVLNVHFEAIMVEYAWRRRMEEES